MCVWGLRFLGCMPYILWAQRGSHTTPFGGLSTYGRATGNLRVLNGCADGGFFYTSKNDHPDYKDSQQENPEFLEVSSCIESRVEGSEVWKDSERLGMGLSSCALRHSDFFSGLFRSIPWHCRGS